MEEWFLGQHVSNGSKLARNRGDEFPREAFDQRSEALKLLVLANPDFEKGCGSPNLRPAAKSIT
jgi:hypothetical protein